MNCYRAKKIRHKEDVIMAYSKHKFYLADAEVRANVLGVSCGKPIVQIEVELQDHIEWSDQTEKEVEALFQKVRELLQFARGRQV